MVSLLSVIPWSWLRLWSVLVPSCRSSGRFYDGALVFQSSSHSDALSVGIAMNDPLAVQYL